jgi:diguanylate cyclase (GGDEF)-like protein
LSCALVAVVPPAVAAYLTPNLWTILAAAGAAIGTTVILSAGHRADRTLADFEKREAQLRTAQSSAEAKMSALEAQLRESSAQDDVSGTLNRRTFLVRLDEAIRRDMRLKKPMAFVLVDIEGFRKLNAEAGRMVGDGVLRTVGRALKASTRGTDFVGRIGGDEFAVVLGECLDPRPAIDRVLVALHGETVDGDSSRPLIVSLGVVTVDSARADVDPISLFRLAEEALATVKGGTTSRCGKRVYPVEEIPPVTALR